MRASLLAVMFAVLLTRALQAQQVWGSVQGRVIDASAPLAGAQVHLTSRDLLGSRSTLTDRNGYYRVHALPPGTYTIRITRLGARPLTIDSVGVQPGHTTSLGTTTLETGAISLDEVRITGNRLAVDPTSTAHGAVLTTADFAVLPAARDYRMLMEILPDIVQSGRGDPLNANGATGLESAYFIDGVNVSDQTNGFWPTTLPYDVIKAVDVKTGGYEAQYGKALGAVVNATTYSGSNDFEVNVFAFATNGALTAKARQQPTLRETNVLRHDVGVRISGPILRDRLWYSAAYNPRLWGSDREIIGQGTFRDHHIMNVFALKTSLRASASTNLELSLFGDPAVHHLVESWGTFTPLNPDPYLSRFEAGNTVGVVRGTMQRKRTLLELSAAHSRGSSSTYGDTEGARNQMLVVDESAQTISGGVGFWNRSDLARSSYAAKGTTTWGAHTTVMGAAYEDVSVFRDFDWYGGYLLVKFANGGYLAHTEHARGSFHNRIPTAYIQNGWRVSDGLTLNTGVRWSTQTLSAASGRTAQRFRDEWQPRLGVVWLPGASRNDRLYASFGRYYMELPLNIATLWYVDYAATDAFYSTDPRQPGAVPDNVVNMGGSESDAPMNIRGLAVENADEIAVGYDRVIASSLKVTTRVMRRDLRSSFQWGFDSTGAPHLGSPGRNDFTFLPRPVREYRALEIGAEGRWRDMSYRGSYLLSRSRGNFPGLFNSDQGFANPGAPGYFMFAEHALNSTGLLPNDHTHLLKLTASRRMVFGVTTGVFLTTQSGSPMNAISRSPTGVAIFAVPRGDAGRTPWTWTADLRMVKALPESKGPRSRLMLDVFNIGNPQTPLRLIEDKYLYQGGSSPPALNPRYGQPLSYQPPLQARVGVEVDF